MIKPRLRIENLGREESVADALKDAINEKMKLKPKFDYVPCQHDCLAMEVSEAIVIRHHDLCRRVLEE